MARARWPATLCLAAMGCGADHAPAPEGSLPPRPATASCQLVGQPAGVVQETLLLPAPIDPAAPSTSDTVATARVDDELLALHGDGTLFLIGMGGATPVLDLSALSSRAIDLDASPSNPGHVFVLYLGHDDVLRLSRFSSTAPPLYDADSEIVVLSSNKTASGALAFASDGLLFAAFGDSASAPEQSVDAADPTTLEGSIARIDVSTIDATGGYTIPPTNPPAAAFGLPGSTPLRTFATGIRRPGGCAVARDGKLWCSDQGIAVGEIHRVSAGRDLGWPTFDGTACTTAGTCDLALERFPQSLIDADDGCPIVAPAVHDGSAFPSLHGTMTFGHSCSGAVYALKTDAPDGYLWRARIASLDVPGASHPLATIVNDAAGDVLVLPETGAALRVEAAHEGVAFPEALSATGCFGPDMSPAPGLVPFEVNAPLWTDGSIKQRYVELPPGTRIDVDDSTHWRFGDGAVIVKTFSYPIDGAVRPVETRLMIKRSHGWEFHSYRWDDAGHDATLLDQSDERVFQTNHPHLGALTLAHTFPSRHACVVCHGSDEPLPLGVRSDQLRRRVKYHDGEADQLTAMAAVGLFAGEVAAGDAMADPSSPFSATTSRARAYLHTNCAHCHRPGGWVPPGHSMDLRYETPFSETGTCDVPATSGSSGTRIVPGDPDASRLIDRTARRDPWQMPPFATNLVDDDGVALLRAWIGGLDGCP